MTDTPTTQPSQQRLTYNEHVFEAAQVFSKQLLAEVPELQSLAIVPAWKVPQEHLPVGLIAGQKGPLETPTEHTRCLEALLGLVHIQYKNLSAVLQQYDQTMVAYAKELDVKQQQLAELERKIAEADETLSGKEAAVRARGGDA